VDYSLLLRELQAYWMDLIFVKQNLELRTKSLEQIERMKSVGTRLSIDDLFRLIRMAGTLENEMKWSQAPRIQFEVAFLRWITMDHTVAIKDILDSLKRAPVTHAVSAPPVAQVTAPRHAPVKTPVPSPLLSPTPSAATAEPPPVTGGLTFEQLRSQWSEIMSKLRKKKPALAATVETGWKPESLSGKKLALRCVQNNSFVQQQVHDNQSHVIAAIAEVTGQSLILVLNREPLAEAEPPKSKSPTAEPETETKPQTTSGSDLFANFIQQFGGVEIDPKTAKEP
jgi:DNA polymerase III gamma/tau subunit